MSDQQGADTLGGPRATGGPSAPRFVRYAQWLWIATAVISFVRSLVQVADREKLVSGLHAQMPQWTQQQVDSAANSTIMSVLVMSGAVVAIYVALSTRLIHGRNWARVVITIVGGLRTVSTVFVLLALGALGMATLTRLSGVPLGPVDIAFSLVTAVVDVAAIVLLFLPESQKHFRAHGRQAGRQQ